MPLSGLAVSLSGAEAAAWIAAIAGGLALLNQAINAIRKRQRERDEIEEALEHAPEVRHQLELGNVGEAVKHLNSIMEAQARYIKDQANQVKHQAEQLSNCSREINHLKDRNAALEHEARGWESKYNEEVRARQQDRRDSDEKIASIQAEMENMKRTFARTLTQLRQQQGNSEPEDYYD